LFTPLKIKVFKSQEDEILETSTTSEVANGEPVGKLSIPKAVI
jgi:hypothetical protein